MPNRRQHVAKGRQHVPKRRQHVPKRRHLAHTPAASLWLSLWLFVYGCFYLWLSLWLFIFLILMTEEELLKKLDTAGSEAQHELEKGTVYF